MKLKSLLLCALLAVGLGGCSIGPDYERPMMDMPDTWQSGSADPGTVINDNWWRMFNDETLNQLVEEALAYNQDLVLAMARVDEARARLGMARSDQLPAVDMPGGFSRQSPSTYSPTYVPGGNREINAWNFGGLLSFEIDLWGKYRRASESAVASLLSSQAARDTVRLTLISDVVDGYYSLRALDLQVQIAEDTLASRKAGEALYRLRFEEGDADEMTYRQAQAESRATETSLRQYQNLRAAGENSLAVLLGRSPRDIIGKPVARGTAVNMVNLPLLVPGGLASDLLNRRPDIWQAEQELRAATANIGVAKAALLPSFSLTGFLGFESVEFNNLFNKNAATWSWGGNMSMPLLNLSVWYGWGVAEAQQRQALASYMKTVQTAYAETQSALLNNRKAREILLARFSQVGALRRALELAQLRYDNGYSDYLEVLDTQRSLFAAELSLADDYKNQLSAVNQLCRALGGGWAGAEKLQPSQ